MTEDKRNNFIKIIHILGNSLLLILAILVTIPSYT